MTWRDDITLGIALTGAVLGILNYWRAVGRDRVRLKVSPQRFVTADSTGLSVEVVNLGFVPVTVSEVAIALRGGDKIVQLISWGSQESLPQRLDPRAAFTFFFTPDTLDNERFTLATCVYAKTACGRAFKGRSKALKGMVTNRRAALDGAA